jgi:hypothetical protein
MGQSADVLHFHIHINQLPFIYKDALKAGLVFGFLEKAGPYNPPRRKEEPNIEHRQESGYAKGNVEKDLGEHLLGHFKWPTEQQDR